MTGTVMADPGDGRGACPFCGGRRSKLKRLWDKYWFRACLDCKATGPHALTKDEADRLWDERRPPVPVQGVLL